MMTISFHYFIAIERGAAEACFINLWRSVLYIHLPNRKLKVFHSSNGRCINSKKKVIKTSGRSIRTSHFNTFTAVKMLMYTVRLLLIIAIYCDGVNSINQTEFSVNAFGDTADDDSIREMVDRTVSILCKLQPNLVHVYYDRALRTNVAEDVILSLGNCVSLMIVQ